VRPGPGSRASTLHHELGLPVVPMDGFHYADVELRRRGLLDRKGAPETFDGEGHTALLRRVRTGEEDVVAPTFERDLEQPLAGAIPVPAAGSW
jgi:pantothenate kinase